MFESTVKLKEKLKGKLSALFSKNNRSIFALKLLFLLVLLVILFVYIYEKMIVTVIYEHPLVNTVENKKVPMYESDPLERGVIVKQAFLAREIKSIHLPFATFDQVNQGTITITLRNESKNIDISYWTIDLSGIENKIPILLETDSGGIYSNLEEYEIIIDTSGLAETDRLSVWMTEKTMPDMELRIGSELRTDSLALAIYVENHYLAHLYAVICICITAILYICIFIYKNEKFPLERKFLIIYIAIGMTYIWLFPINSNADETAHIIQAYKQSNWVMGSGISVENDQIWMRMEDVQYMLNRKSLDSHGAYSYMIEKVWKTCTDSNIGSYTLRNLSIVPYVYFPQAFGIIVSRVLNLNFVTLYFISRFCNFITFAFLAYYSIKRAPPRKNYYNCYMYVADDPKSGSFPVL